jgi:ketosteroid isomerase-like protein
MEFLSEDPTYLAGGLGLLGLALLIAVRVTQRGRYLIAAVVALALAAAAVVVERLWVTDAERIERVVYDLAHAVEHSDAKAVLAHLTPDAQYVRSGTGPAVSGALLRAFITTSLEQTRFDFVRIARLHARAGRQSRRGEAEFRVVTGGSHRRSGTDFNFASTDLDFSLGLRETEPGVWKVERISPTRVPRDMPMP